MTIYNNFNYDHKTEAKIGILLVNLGTPEAPTPSALRNYLNEFLADPRITELPRWLWWLILHGIILRTRPKHSAKKYQNIWTESGSPLLEISKIQLQELRQAIQANFEIPTKIVLGMRYGNPSIATGLEELRQANARYILILPLYPQYSSTSSGSVFDAVSKALKGWRWIPDIRFISHYHDHPTYIQTLVIQIKKYWTEHGTPDKLLFSFHGIPKRFFLNGDPYYCECQKTARLVAEQLDIPSQVVFQSRFGREEWLKPYTDETLIALGKAGLKRVDVVCPGFATDCLETLEEIDKENRQNFLQAGGKEFHYIPALNDSSGHIQLLLELITQHTQGWNPTTNTNQQFEIFTKHKKTSQI
ncbi:ferrochelatase [Candidatus Halobeggiatoa sp. HSG11]|nr:ferrochelatase [Candidatus Halobeggiatoa sp. HSG11]